MNWIPNLARSSGVAPNFAVRNRNSEATFRSPDQYAACSRAVSSNSDQSFAVNFFDSSDSDHIFHQDRVCAGHRNFADLVTPSSSTHVTVNDGSGGCFATLASIFSVPDSRAFAAP
ncbi:MULTISPECIES: hypothetical protein [unclassified Mycobacterium]|uniref:hypothetical protein n=1 Tax=unclassified Mycobacterium TaxID=2642494 RepID=UPI0027417481|nr:MULTISPECIES: hypothetical protein [unclassified Mycobacterium]MDP7703192.1 hypothetical protein [Mycobacterium sp. TY815]MDP7721797.1 hypothetical protein [Mycobacterium sp. TY814]